MKSLVNRFTKTNTRNVRRVVVVTKRFEVIDRLLAALIQRAAAAVGLWHLAAPRGLGLMPVLHPATSATAEHRAPRGSYRRRMATRMSGRGCSGLPARLM